MLPLKYQKRIKIRAFIAITEMIFVRKKKKKKKKKKKQQQQNHGHGLTFKRRLLDLKYLNVRGKKV